METKICKHCQSTFEVTDDDLAFYDKVSPIFPLGVNPVFSGEGEGSGVRKYAIPSPTFCPDCRQQRRLSFRNERKLYKRKCDLMGKDIISIYSPDKPYKVYDQKERRGNARSPLEYGVNFDSGKNFFAQFDALLKKAPLISLYGQGNENCDFTFDNNFSKNCYMSVVVDDGENVFYSNRVLGRSRDVVDSYYILRSSLVYESMYIKNCHDVKYCFSCKNSTSITLCSFCENCEECIGCKNLKGKKFHIFNQPYSREEYLKQKETFDLKIFSEKARELFSTLPVKANTYINTENCEGGDLEGCINCSYAFNGEDSKDVKFTAHFSSVVDCYDAEDICYNISLAYEGQTIVKNNNHVLFSLFMMEGNTKCLYSTLLTGCNNCFGCIGLRNQSYCILNKQYTKAEYETLVPQIIKKMKADGERGEFFPSSLSPFGYNETVAQEYFPLTKEEALAKGFKRSDYEAPFPKGDGKDVVICEVSGKPFRLIPQEIEFYKKHNLPLPTKHPDVRHTERMKLRNPRKLRDRKCAKCSADIKTSYAAERPEIVYCESCYNKEIYG